MCDITIPNDFETLTTQGSGFYVSAEVDIQDMSDSELCSQIEGKTLLKKVECIQIIF